MTRPLLQASLIPISVQATHFLYYPRQGIISANILRSPIKWRPGDGQKKILTQIPYKKSATIHVDFFQIEILQNQLQFKRIHIYIIYRFCIAKLVVISNWICCSLTIYAKTCILIVLYNRLTSVFSQLTSVCRPDLQILCVWNCMAMNEIKFYCKNLFENHNWYKYK